MRPLTPRIVRLCESIEESPRYRRCKRFFHDLMENDNAPFKRYYDLVLITLVLASIGVLIYDVKHPAGPLARGFELTVVSIFIVEYLLRLWLYNDAHRDLLKEFETAELMNEPFRLSPALWRIARRKWEYVSSPLAIVDLLAILPSYRPLRLLRIFLLFRLFKVFRYSQSLQEFGRVLAEKRFELGMLAMFVGLVVFAASTAMFMFEAGESGSHVGSFFDAVYWAFVTIATVGYGDVVPVTMEGRVVAIMLIVSGIAVISFSTSIIVTAFTEKFRKVADDRVYATLRSRRAYTIVCGYGRMGEAVVERLAGARDPFVIVDRSEAAVEKARQQGHLAILSNAAEHELLERIGIRDRAATLLCVTGDDITNIFMTLSARHLSKSVRILARANKKESVLKLVRAGANHVVSPYEMVGMNAAEYIGQPVAFDAIYGLVTGTRGVVLEGVVVLAGSAAEHRRVGDLPLLEYRLLLFGVLRDVEQQAEQTAMLNPLHGGAFRLPASRFYFRPAAAFHLHARDILVVFGYEASVHKFRKFLETRGA